MENDSNSLEITRVLRAAVEGDEVARERLATNVYEELKRTAERLMKWEPQQTLQPTALVNEAYLRLFENGDFVHVPDRSYFFAAASQAMKRILVEAARRRKSLKRGGQFHRQPLDDILDQYESQKIDLIELDAALVKLEQLSPRQASVVHLRWFIELPVKEVAEILDVSLSTVEQDWRAARAFLKRELLVSKNS